MHRIIVGYTANVQSVTVKPVISGRSHTPSSHNGRIHIFRVNSCTCFYKVSLQLQHDNTLLLTYNA